MHLAQVDTIYCAMETFSTTTALVCYWSEVHNQINLLRPHAPPSDRLGVPVLDIESKADGLADISHPCWG